MQVFAPSETGPHFSGNTVPLEWGPVVMHPHLNYSFSYGNGVQSSPGQQQDTIVQQFSPGVLFNLGSHWTMDYTPTLNFYSDSHFRDTVDHSVNLGWGGAYGDWFIGVSQSYASSSDPRVETGAQTDQETYGTGINASHQFNDKVSLDVGLSQNLSYVGNGGSATNLPQNLANSRSWSTMEWLNYQFWPRLSVGVGAGGGYTVQDGSPDSVNEQYQGRVNWRATDKVSFMLSGGLQDQQYLSGGTSDLVTPIFSATIQYQPFEQTRFSVSASRTVSPSYFQGQTTENTGITGGVNQRLLGKLYLDLSGGYSTTRYVSTVTGPSAGRDDNSYSFSARLSCPVLKRGKFSVFYQYGDNASSQSGFGYASSQVGFEIGYQY